MTPMKAIRLKCLDCCCGSSKEVSLCQIKTCSLYIYRDGHNPNRKGIANKGSFKKSLVEPSLFDKEGEE